MPPNNQNNPENHEITSKVSQATVELKISNTINEPNNMASPE